MAWKSIGGYSSFGQWRGSVIVFQCLNALSRQSSSHCGSSFLAEMNRTVSSDSPGGTVSDSMSVSKPYWYSRLASVSISVVSVGMGQPIRNSGTYRETEQRSLLRLRS